MNDIRSLVEQSPQNIENINLKTADSALRKRLWHELALMQTVSITSSSSMNIEVSAVNTGKGSGHCTSMQSIRSYHERGYGNRRQFK